MTHLMSESAVQQRGRFLAAHYGQNWRNNSGAFQDETGRWIRYGLANDSKQMNDENKSSDTVGIRTVLITPDMVGQVIGVFYAIEFKPEGWHRTPGDKRAAAQARWHEIVKAAGGWAGFATCDDDVRKILRVAP